MPSTTRILLDHLLLLPLVVYTTFLALDQAQLRRDLQAARKALQRAFRSAVRARR